MELEVSRELHSTERRDCDSFIVIKFLGKFPRQAEIVNQTGEGMSKKSDIQVCPCICM
jgi:hypothetical protein